MRTVLFRSSAVAALLIAGLSPVAFRPAASGHAAPGANLTVPAPASEGELAKFRAALRAKVKAADKDFSMTVVGRDGWLFFTPELRHAAAGTFWGEDAAKVSQSTFAANADPMPAILDFKAQLDRAGIELLMVPVPPKALIYPDKIWQAGAAANRFDNAHQEFYDLLRSQGVNVLDLTSDFLGQRDAAAGPLYCRQDTHWSGRACVLAAQRIAQELKGREWLATTPREQFASQWKRVTISGDLWQAFPAATKPPKESLSLRFVGRKNKTGALIPVAPSLRSQVLLLGDSHDLVFHAGDDMHTRGAGLPDQLAHELGFPVDLIAVRGSGATPARTSLLRRARADAGYLKGKKLVIWCFSAREFTESLGWQKVPVVR